MRAKDLLSLASLHVFYTPKLQPKLYEDHLRKKKHILQAYLLWRWLLLLLLLHHGT
jgi:hypothetical protein